MLIAPVVHVDAINRDMLNDCLAGWGHRMGPLRRPVYMNEWLYGLFHNGECVAVAAAAQLIGTHAGGLSRSEAFELARLCAVRPHINRGWLRIWREFVAPAIARQHGYRFVISYQHKTMHSGNLYRFDGWQRIGESRSGSDKRSGRRGYSKVIWCWEFESPAPDHSGTGLP